MKQSRQLSRYFNPRSPHGERRDAAGERKERTGISTHAPRTGSDVLGGVAEALMEDFNPRSPHGERRNDDVICRQHLKFQPTLPARGATAQAYYDSLDAAISTHAPRTGSDSATMHKSSRGAQNFNPRSPHGERPRPSPTPFPSHTPFQPTLPARGATNSIIHCCNPHVNFNPRSPHGERHLTSVNS